MSRSRSLHQVQLVDLEIGEQSQRLRVVEASLGETEELREARRSAQDAEGRLRALQKTLRDQEMNLADLTHKIETEETRLYSGEIKNPKELAGIQEEVWYLKRRGEEMEEAMLDTMLRIDEAEQALAARRQHLGEVETRWTDDQARLGKEREALRARLAELVGRRKDLVTIIEKGDLSVYEELRAVKAGQAVATLETGICRGCGVGLPSNKARQAQQGQILTFCDNCGRILHALSSK